MRISFLNVVATAVLLCNSLSAQALDASELFQVSGATAFDVFGAAIASVGDINGDGVSDFVGGAPRTNANSIGFAAVLSGVDGSTLLSFNGVNAGDNFGISVAGIGDVNGDAIPDIVVGPHSRLSEIRSFLALSMFIQERMGILSTESRVTRRRLLWAVPLLAPGT